MEIDEQEISIKVAKIKATFKNIGWIPREDLIWMINTLEEFCNKNLLNKKE